MREILDKYIEEAKQDLDVNQFNIKEVQMRLPARKHFWVARLINTKSKLEKTKKTRQKLKYKIVQQVIDQSPIKLSISAANNAADNNETMIKITEKIKELELIVEYLDGVVKILNTMHWEIKNIIELMQMEMQ